MDNIIKALKQVEFFNIDDLTYERGEVLGVIYALESLISLLDSCDKYNLDIKLKGIHGNKISRKILNLPDEEVINIINEIYNLIIIKNFSHESQNK